MKEHYDKTFYLNDIEVKVVDGQFYSMRALEKIWDSVSDVKMDIQRILDNINLPKLLTEQFNTNLLGCSEWISNVDRVYSIEYLKKLGLMFHDKDENDIFAHWKLWNEMYNVMACVSIIDTLNDGDENYTFI